MNDIRKNTMLDQEGDRITHGPTLYWVGVYCTHLRCGGSEEGGWWYDSGELVTDLEIYRMLKHSPTSFFEEEHAEAYAEEMRKHLASLNEGRHPKSSTRCEGILEVHVFENATLPAAFPETRPHYQ